MVYMIGEVVEDYREFTDNNGNLFDPPVLKIDIFDKDGNKLDENLDPYSHPSDGCFNFLYTVPNVKDYFVIQWKYNYSEILTIVLNRTIIDVYNAEDYWADLDFADHYSNMKNWANWQALNRSEKLAKLLQATEIMRQLPYRAEKTEADQADIFPRTYFHIDATLSFSLPDIIKKCVCEYAYWLIDNENNIHLRSQELGILSQKIGGQTTAYTGGQGQAWLPTHIYNMAKPWIKTSGSFI